MQKILIITVGNRQIGWLCQDEKIRCLSTTAKPATPEADPIAHLYNELGATRPPGNYVVRHLGELLYQQCQATQDFSRVQLLMDHEIIENLLSQKPERRPQTVWLVATDQPITVSDHFRAGDTIWLAELIAGKLRQTWPDLEIKICPLRVNLSDSEAIRTDYASLLLKIFGNSENEVERSTLWLQTKGSTPQMSSGLEICAAALSRDVDVQRMIPQETSEDLTEGIAAFSTEFSREWLSQYFLPLEKPKIMLAWERGEFGAAVVIQNDVGLVE